MPPTTGPITPATAFTGQFPVVAPGATGQIAGATGSYPALGISPAGAGFASLTGPVPALPVPRGATLGALGRAGGYHTGPQARVEPRRASRRRVAPGAASWLPVQRYQPHGLANAISGGLILGLLLWIVGPLTLIPVLVGEELAWTAGGVAGNFPALLGSLFLGAAGGWLFHLMVRRYAPPGQRAAGRGGRTDARVIVLGGGFGGVSAANAFERLFPRNLDLEVTLVSRSNYMLYTPMLAEVAASSIEASYISVPVRAACPSTRFRWADVEGVDPIRQQVAIRPHGADATEVLPYDHLVIALGTVPDFLELPGVEDNSFTLKSLDDATRLRNHVIECLEQAEQTDDPEVRRRKLAFVVAGAGFAGTEMIAGIFDLVHEALHLFPALSADQARFVLVHSRDRILPDIGPELADTALRKLRSRGIEFVLGARVSGATEHSVSLSNGLTIPTETLVWTAGNRPNPVIAGFQMRRNKRGQIPVDDTLQVCGYDNIWAVGDCAEVPDPAKEGSFCPPTAQHAMRQGKAVARNIVAYELGLPLAPFRFKTLGFLVSLGHRTAAAELRGIKLTGIPAWLLWRGIYLVKLPGAEKRMRVLFDWIIDLFFPRDIALTKSDGQAGRTAERVAAGAGGRQQVA